MKRIPSFRPVVLGLALLLTTVSSVQPYAQASGSYSTGGSQQFSLPSFGSVSGGGGATTLFEADFNAGLGFDLGCGGIGLFDFMKSTFDLGNIVEEFKGSLNTMLSKALVTFAMSTPQIASLFDTLNAFGNARFDMFNQSCDINQIRADVKQKYMEKCIAEGKAPDQCTNMTGGAQDILADVTKQFATLLRQAENINEFLRGPMCGGSSGSYNPNDMGCMVMAFMPQFRLCLRSSLGESCPSEGYGARPAALSIGTLADGSTMAAGLYLNNMDAVYRSNQIRNLPQNVQDTAYIATVNQAANGVEPQAAQASLRANSIMPAADSGGDEKTQKLIEEFRKQIACPNEENPFKLLQLYLENLERITGKSFPTVNTEVDLSYIKDEIGKQILGALKDAYENDIEGVKETLEIGTRCMLVRAASDDPGQWMDIASLDGPDGTSAKESTANEVGYLLGMEIATFVQNMIKKGVVQMSVDQATGPVLAAAHNAEQNGTPPEEFSSEQAQEELTEALREPVKESATSMIEELEKMKQALTKRYESDKVRLEKRRQIKALRNNNLWEARARQ